MGNLVIVYMLIRWLKGFRDDAEIIEANAFGNEIKYTINEIVRMYNKNGMEEIK